MNTEKKWAIRLFICFCLALPCPGFSEDPNEAVEPAVASPAAVDLLEGGTLDSWDVPSARWRVDEGCIVGDTSSASLETPEWLYTRQRFRDFVFTCEVELSGDGRRNSGIYYRVNPFLFRGHEDEETETGQTGAATGTEHDAAAGSFRAPSGYEMDAYHGSAPGLDGPNYWGSLGDWYKRPGLRIFADREVIKRVLKSQDWNRLTVRARGNRLEHWLNGFKVLDYVDHDPVGSREGVIGLQIHDGSNMTVRFRNIYVLSLEP